MYICIYILSIFLYVCVSYIFKCMYICVYILSIFFYVCVSYIFKAVRSLARFQCPNIYIYICIYIYIDLYMYTEALARRSVCGAMFGMWEGGAKSTC